MLNFSGFHRSGPEWESNAAVKFRGLTGVRKQVGFSKMHHQMLLIKKYGLVLSDDSCADR